MLATVLFAVVASASMLPAQVNRSSDTSCTKRLRYNKRKIWRGKWKLMTRGLESVWTKVEANFALYVNKVRRPQTLVYMDLSRLKPDTTAILKGIRRFNSTILSEQIIYHRNEYLSVEIVGEGEDSVIYMNIDKTIDAGDNISLKLILKHDTNPSLRLVLFEVDLCSLLLNEVNEPDGLQAKYTTSQAFNLDGYQCPIQETVVKMVPWVLTKQHSFEADVTCGTYHYEVTLDQCRPYDSCNPLIVADLEVTMTADNCYQ